MTPVMSLDRSQPASRADKVARTVIRARAPLRLGLAGGGTDLSPFCDQFGGCVLNATISMYATCTITLCEGGEPMFRANDLDIEESLSCPPENYRLPLHRGVYNRMIGEFGGGRDLPVILETRSDAPAGSGLGSSSTLVVAMVKAFAELLSLRLSEYDIAHLAWAIERLDQGLSGGKQDQYAATFGGFNFMEFFEEDRVVVNPLRIKDWIAAEFEGSLILYDSGVSRVSSTIIDRQITNVVRENESAMEAMKALKQEAILMKEDLLRGRVHRIAERMRMGWEAKKRTSPHVSNAHIDETFRVALTHGALAGKVSGAGGGGFIVFFVESPQRSQLERALRSRGGTIYPCHFVDHGATAWKLG